MNLTSKNYNVSIIILLLLCTSQFVFSQATVSGIVTSPTNETPAFANVLLLLAKDSSFVKGVVCDDSGQFKISQVAAGDYLVSASMVGFEITYSSPFTTNGTDDIALESIPLQETALEEVVVAALRPMYEQRIDHIIINVNNSITSAGGNALEVLTRSPGIEVNEINNVISINGKAGVQILIDGKISRLPTNTVMDILRSMDANNIDKIELYETPPAHLDAEGNGGVINIVLIKNENIGTNGSYSLNAGYGRRLKYGASLNLNHRTEKLNIYGSYSFRHRFSRETYLFDRTVNQLGDLVQTESENKREGEAMRNAATIGLDYNLTKNTIVGFLASGYFTYSENNSNNTSTFSKSDQPFSIIENVNHENSKKRYGLLNLNLQHQFAQKATLSFDVDYLQYDSDNPSDYFNDFFDGEKNLLNNSEIKISSTTPINNLSAKIDFSKSISDKLSFQLGLKGTSSQFNNTVEVNELVGNSFIPLADFSQDYDLQEGIGAAYGSVDYQWDEKTKINVGLRYEYTDYLLTTPDNPKFLDRNFGYFFPSFFLSRNVNETDQFQLSYSRRISRPAFNELAPFVTFIDPNTFFIGNPELQPGISNNIKTSYRFKTVLLSLNYGYSQDPILVFQPVIDPETNTQFLTTLNLDEEHSANLSLVIPLHPQKWWDIQNKISGSLERLILHEEGGHVNLDTRAFSISMVNTFKLPKQITLEVAGQYKSPAYYGLLNVSARGYLNIGLQKKLRNGTLRMNWTDLLRTNVWQSNTTITELGLDNRLVVDVETRVFTLSYFANFGKATVKGKRRRSTGSEEAQRRIR